MQKLLKILKTLPVKDMDDFVFGILTEKELDEIETRIKIVEMLFQGIPHHTIAKELGVGVGTVTRGAKEIKKGRFKYLKLQP